MVKVRQIMVPEVTAEEDMTVLEASRVLCESHHGTLVLLDKGRPDGIITEKDVVRKVVAENRNPEKLKISEVMSSPLVTVDPEMDIQDAASIMVEKGIRRLPVVEDDRLVGLVTVTEISKYVAERRSVWEKMLNSMGRYAYPPY